MKDIQFTKQGKTYVAEFEVNADFNLHIEKSQSGYLYMQQRSTSGKWDSVRNFQATDSDYIVDYDFTALVYPKQIRLVSKYAPTMCVLTSDGDVIEIKSQSKEVEITQNGEMSVTPDDGFAYLSSVNVKTNVPQQGGGESGGEIYIKEEPEKMTDLLIGSFSYLTKVEKLSGEKFIIPSAQYFASFSINPEEAPTPLSYMVLGDTYIDTDAGRMKIKDRISQFGMELTEITKEEFYNLES